MGLAKAWSILPYDPPFGGNRQACPLQTSKILYTEKEKEKEKEGQSTTTTAYIETVYCPKKIISLFYENYK